MASFEQDFKEVQQDAGTPIAKSQILQFIAQEFGSHVLEMWFDNGHAITIDGNSVRIVAASEFQLGRIKSRFNSALKTAIGQVFGVGADLIYELSEEDPVIKPESSDNRSRRTLKFPTAPVSAPAEQTQKTEVEPPRRQRRSLESFWFGQTNRIVEAGVSQAFECFGQICPLVVYGPTGCGKTHLLEGFVNDARRKKRLKRCVYLSAEQFTANFVDALRGTGLPSFRRKYRDLDVLAVDDVQFFGGKSATLAEFQYTVDHLLRNGKQVVLSSDRAPVELTQLGAEIIARMNSGLTCPLQYPDAVGRSRIVREICRERNFEIADEIQDLVSQNLARDVRRLSGALNRINALSIANEGSVTLEDARLLLTDLFSVNGTVTSIDKIEKVVCDFCGVKPADLKSSSRRKKISSARMLAMYLSRQHTTNACSEIGDYFGGRSHSTVIAAQKKVSLWLKQNTAIDLPNAKYPAKDAVVRIESNLRIG